MNGLSATGALLGIVAAAGILLTVARWRRLRRPRLVDRARSALRRRDKSTMEQPVLRLLVELFAPIFATLGRTSASPASLSLRLQAAGRSGDITRHRLVQLVWLLSGFVGGCLAGLAIAISRSASMVIVLVFAAGGATAAHLLQDWLLSNAAKRRGRRMGEQLPTVAELLAFAVAAGEPPLAAIDRVAHTVDGELASELSTVVADVRVGSSITQALRDLADRTRSQAVGRFVDGIVVSLERGSPLAEVMRAQASDARAAGRRQLMESAGRREVAMLVPVVFLILPIVVVIALFPGVYGITLSIP